MDYPISSSNDTEPPSGNQPNLVSIPNNENCTIWRYTSLAKFLNVIMLGTSEGSSNVGNLVFVRADVLEDEYEGTISDATQMILENYFGKDSEQEQNKMFMRCMTEALESLERDPSFVDTLIISTKCAYQTAQSTDDKPTLDAIIQQIENIGVEPEVLEEKNLDDVIRRSNIRQSTFLNCWRMDEYESSNMWRAYTTKSDGIAIKSSFIDFCNSFIEWPGILYIGDIDYINFDEEKTPLDPISPFFYKRRQFIDESEVRAVCTDYDQPRSKFALDGLTDEDRDYTRNIKVNLNELIDEIVVHPQSGEYMTAVVEKTLNCYDIYCDVSHSSLRPE